jgi:chromosome segregation ATPase
MKQDYDSQIQALQDELKNQKRKALEFLDEKEREIRELQNKLRASPEDGYAETLHRPNLSIQIDGSSQQEPELSTGSNPSFGEIKRLREHIIKLQQLLRDGEVKLSEEQHRCEELRAGIVELERSKKRSHLNFE